jgi:hypothetical protein
VITGFDSIEYSVVQNIDEVHWLGNNFLNFFAHFNINF